jgi:hypothetical protein
MTESEIMTAVLESFYKQFRDGYLCGRTPDEHILLRWVNEALQGMAKAAAGEGNRASVLECLTAAQNLQLPPATRDILGRAVLAAERYSRSSEHDLSLNRALVDSCNAVILMVAAQKARHAARGEITSIFHRLAQEAALSLHSKIRDGLSPVVTELALAYGLDPERLMEKLLFKFTRLNHERHSQLYEGAMDVYELFASIADGTEAAPLPPPKEVDAAA